MTSPIVIAGGGPVGMCLALRLFQSGRDCVVLEAKAQGAYYQDHRALALSQASKLMLENLDVWSRIPAVTPINSIHVSQKGSFGRSVLRASDYDMAALGYVLSYGHLMQAIDQVLSEYADKSQAAKITIHYNTEVQQIIPNNRNTELHIQQGGQAQTLTTALAVLADGGRSLKDIPGIERINKEYGHHALVCKVAAELAHDGIAYERFTPMGPVALLPNGEREFSLVWTGETAGIEPLLELSDDVFLAQLHQHFGDRVGRFTQVQKRICFPLKLSYLSPVTAPHLVVIGNAAQTMHPVAGQGFNVGLRDAWELAELIMQTDEVNLGAASFLQTYQASRQQDTQRGLKFTDFLVRFFSNDIAGLGGIRSLGLGLFDALTPAKAHLVRKMSFGSKG